MTSPHISTWADATGAGHFGAPWRGFIASLPLDDTPDGTSWPQWYASRRLLPYLRMAMDSGALGAGTDGWWRR